jgi:hypothetical protein|tara:strand:- start:20797 stop:21141 length:345 start_codon:yes stop_codon:yes gene_type:complete
VSVHDIDKYKAGGYFALGYSLHYPTHLKGRISRVLSWWRNRAVTTDDKIHAYLCDQWHVRDESIRTLFCDWHTLEEVKQLFSVLNDETGHVTFAWHTSDIPNIDVVNDWVGGES